MKALKELKRELVRAAHKRFKKIKACRNCFMRYTTPAGIDLLTFWFNTEDNSTHITEVEIKQPIK